MKLHMYHYPIKRIMSYTIIKKIKAYTFGGLTEMIETLNVK